MAVRRPSMAMASVRDALYIDYSLSYGHHGLSPCSTHLGEGAVSIVRAVGPVLTSETTKIAPALQCSDVLDSGTERHWGTE